MNAIKVLGLNLVLEDWDGANKLPIYILNYFSIKRVFINGYACTMLTPLRELPTIPTIKKQISLIGQIDGLPVFLKTDDLSSFRKNSLLKDNIPFVYKDKLAYLPFIGTLLTNTTTRKETNKGKFMISTQLLFTWILYNKNSRYYVSDAASILPFSAMTLTRAYKQLVAAQLFNEHKDGRKIYLTTIYSKRELMTKADSLFVTPVLKVGYINKSNLSSDFISSGESVLSYLSMLNSPHTSVYAINKDIISGFELTNELVYPNNQVKVEIWHYNPLLLSNDGENIDILSLYLSFKDTYDERLLKIMEELINDWIKSI